jgi:phosphoglycerate dehydrogenase-like enzyme
MANSSFSRRNLIAAAGVAAAAQAQTPTRQPVTNEPYPSTNVKAVSTPIRIVTTYEFEPHEMQKIQAATSTKVEIVMCKSRDEFRRELRDAEVVYGGFNGPDLDYAPKLKWVQGGGAGVEWMDEKFRQSPIVMTNYARTFAHGISETAIGLLLALTRRLAQTYIPQFAKRTMNPVGTVKSPDHVEISGKTMGIVGLGGIGSMIARRAHYGFDMKILATDAKPIPQPEYVAELHDPGWFMKMVPQVDVLVAAAPSTPKTRRMFNETVFRSMKKSAYFLAMSRGDLFDDMALVKALKESWIAGAGLDVFPQEPPPSTHPIYDCPNVVMSAHTSGWSVERQVRLIDVFAENVRRYAEGLPLINVVDKPAGY